ncbi:MAG TPA: hypothetical protein VEF76_08050 [Patescibacteria group bacterium]|nr:hypothetical protein [Patescibacteria group bacterium]
MPFAIPTRPTRTLRIINASLLVALGFMGVVLLSGCAGQPVHSSANAAPVPTMAERKAAEEQAWTRVGSLSPQRCGVTPRPPSRDLAVPQSACVSEIVWQEVIPVAAFPNLVKDSRATAMRLANEYSAGKLSPVEYQKRSVARLKEYRTRWAMLAAQSEIGYVEHATAKPQPPRPAQPARVALKPVPQPQKVAQN